MCGICFSIRSSASFPSTGASPSSPASSLPGASPAGSATSAPSPAQDLGPDYGIPRPDGSRAQLHDMLDHNDVWDEMCDSVASRGPDAANSYTTLVQPSGQRFAYELRFHASVLHMRGRETTTQPFVSEATGDVLVWNGEVFDGLEVGPEENDGQKLFDRIEREGPSNFFAAIREVEGPYAFVYYQAATERIFFARDPLGRRSLLMHKPTPVSAALLLSSCGLGVDHALNEWEEVSCDAVHCYQLRDLKGKSWLSDKQRGLISYPRYPKSMGISQDILIYPFDRLLASLPTPAQLLPTHSTTKAPIPTPQLNIAIQSLLTVLTESVRRRVTNIPSSRGADGTPGQAKVAVLFSGGIDCTTVALLADKTVPEGEPIDLINVAFENPRQLQAAAKHAAHQFKAAKPRKVNTQKKGTRHPLAQSTTPADLPDNLDAMDLDPNSRASTRPSSPDPAPPPIPGSSGAASASASASGSGAGVYEVPDRLTGRDSWRELRQLCPRRRFNFVEVDVPYEEMREHRGKVIELMRPQRTVMDLSISLAFYFAARGRGTIEGPGGPAAERVAYTSTARVLLSGLGADELLGGYSRHRKTFGKKPEGDWQALVEELQMDLDRLGTRNLGRDDRIISFHGKEARYPFLAASVVEFCARTPVWLKCDPRFPESVGEKLLLRLLAKRLGLEGAGGLKKRAVHFGARTAKMEEGSGGAQGEDLIVE